MDAVSIITIVIGVIIVGMMLVSMLCGWKIGTASCYWIVSIVGAIVLLLINFSHISDILSVLVSDSAINPIKILIFFLSMTIMSLILDKLHFFKFLANKSAKLAKSSQWKLFFIFYAMVSVLTIFTSNDIVILSFVPFICYFCKNHKINPTPYVFSTFVAANTWSMIFIIGNPTNVYVGTFAKLGFVEYFVNMALPTIVCCLVSLLVLVVLFHKFLNKPIVDEEKEEVVINKLLVVGNVIILSMCIVMLAISSYIGLEMWYLALGFVVIQILFNIITVCFGKWDKKYITLAIKSAPWEFAPFLISMFLVVCCLNANGVTKVIANLVFSNNSIFVYGIASFLCCNVINNIPMTTLFTSILANTTYTSGSIFASIIGSNLGALLSPVGALAGIMFLNILREKDVDFSIKSFVKYGCIVSSISIVVSLGVLVLF